MNVPRVFSVDSSPLRSHLVPVLALALLALAGCGGGNDDEQALSVGYAFGADIGDAGDRVAFRRAEEDAGVTVSYRDMGGVENAVAGLVKGDVALASVPYHLVVAAISQGAGIRMVLPANAAAEYIIAGGPGVETIEDLRGKRVANSLPGGDTVLRAALDKAGMSAKDVKLVTLRDSPAKAAALLSGRVDAATLEYTDYERLRGEEPGLNLVTRQVDVFPPYPGTVWAVSSEWADEHRELLQQVVNGLLDGYATLYTPDGKAAWTAQAKDILPDTKAAQLAKVYAYYREIGFWPPRVPVFSPMAHDRVVRAYMDTGGLEKPEPYDRVWEPSFWRNADES